MLTLPGKRLAFLLSKPNPLPFLSQRLGSHRQLKYLMATAKLSELFNHKLQSGKLYEVLGYTKETDLSKLTDVEVKRQYLAMVKKYHSDGVVDPQDKLQNQQITKCIIQAYDRISSERVREQINRGIYDKIYKDEDEIAMKIFGKKFDEIKYELYKEGNYAKRAQFMEELQKIRNSSANYEKVHPRPEFKSAAYNEFKSTYSSNSKTRSNSSSDYSSQKGSNGAYMISIPVLAVVLGFLYQSQNKKQQRAAIEKAEKAKSKMTLGEDRIKEIEKKSIELYEKKLSDLINSYVEQQPPALKYPSKDDPQQIEQLIEYTIGPDINLYEVSSQLLGNKQNIDKLKTLKTQEEVKQSFGQNYEPFPLSRLKVNTAITMSLQAERCLQNIYIKVKDVADQIEETGKFTPPKIFFRFYGYLMFDIREKPLSLENYRQTEWVSLFDLLFDYYSPIPVKRHEYNEYLVGFKDDDMKMYGQVHINHRKIPQRYIGRHDKIVVMKDDVANEEEKNKQIWDHYYKKYMRVWTRGFSDRIRTEHQ